MLLLNLNDTISGTGHNVRRWCGLQVVFCHVTEEDLDQGATDEAFFLVFLGIQIFTGPFWEESRFLILVPSSSYTDASGLKDEAVATSRCLNLTLGWNETKKICFSYKHDP